MLVVSLLTSLYWDDLGFHLSGPLFNGFALHCVYYSTFCCLQFCWFFLSWLGAARTKSGDLGCFRISGTFLAPEAILRIAVASPSRHISNGRSWSFLADPQCLIYTVLSETGLVWLPAPRSVGSCPFVSSGLGFSSAVVVWIRGSTRKLLVGRRPSLTF